MSTRRIGYLGLMFAAALIVFVFIGEAEAAPMIRVSLSMPGSSIEIGGPGTIICSEGNVTINMEGSNSLHVEAYDNRVWLNGDCFSELRAQPHTTDDQKYLRINGKGYRGDLLLSANGNRIKVINEVDLEDYLLGVVPLEMTPTWPLEALKAQAVAARTFAVRNLGRHGADGFDLCDAPHCQAYGGVQAEHLSSTAAVRATNQLVLRYFGELVQAFYHSSSGGSTENAGNVWGQDLPYLTQVEEGIELAGPYGFWEEILSMAELSEKLVKAGFPVGQVRSIEIAQKSPSGRVNSVNVFGTGGTTLIAGTDLRQALNLKSTLFDIKDGATVSQNGEEIEIQVLGSLGSAGALFVNSGTYVVGSKGIELIESRLAANVPSRGGSRKSIVLHGSGYGHGVGMSQWGAKYLAEQPSFGGDDSFKQILTHYYNGVTIEPY